MQEAAPADSAPLHGEVANRKEPPNPAPQRKPKPRDPFFDNAKYLAIVLVACGHAWEPLTDSSRTAEALYMAGVSPLRAAGKVSRDRYVLLADAVKAVLGHAIERGGTTLRDFISPDGAPGYFEQELNAYGRGGAPCRRCGRALRQALIGQRTSVWCPACQR